MITKRTINEARAQLDAAQRGTRQRQLRYADIDEAVTAYREFRAGIKRRDLPLDADTVKVERYGGGVSRAYAYPASSTYVTVSADGIQARRATARNQDAFFVSVRATDDQPYTTLPSITAGGRRWFAYYRWAGETRYH